MILATPLPLHPPASNSSSSRLLASLSAGPSKRASSSASGNPSGPPPGNAPGPPLGGPPPGGTPARSRLERSGNSGKSAARCGSFCSLIIHERLPVGLRTYTSAQSVHQQLQCGPLKTVWSDDFTARSAARGGRQQSAVSGQRPAASGQQSAASGQQPAASGQRSPASSQQ